MKNTKLAKISPRLVATFFALSWCVTLLPTVEAAPTISFTHSCSKTLKDGWCRGTETFSIVCTATPGYTFLSLSYQIDGGPYTTQTASSSSFTYSEEGTHTVHAICHDSSLVDSDATITVQIDRTAPTLTATMPLIVMGGKSWEVNITVADSVSGLTGTFKVEEIATPGGTTTAAWLETVSGNSRSAIFTSTASSTGFGAGYYCYRVTVSDVAGNPLDQGTSCVYYVPMA
jgi:hypothetical protein